MMNKNNLFILLAFSLITSCTAVNRNRTVMIPMRDGVKLSTLLIFPKTNQKKYPVILIRSPYKKEIYTGKYNYLVENGYVLALQDVRGRFASEGKFEPFINEGKDGYDAIEWIARQKWCDGNIGMIGASYNGWVQYCAAVEKPPHLKTIIPNCASVDLFYDIPYRYGVFTQGVLMWMEIAEDEATTDLIGKKMQEIYGKNWDQLLNHLPVSDLDTLVLSKRIDYYQKWVQHNSKDDYWKQSCDLEKLKNIKIPVFIQSGWFDSQLPDSKLAYNELRKAGNKNVKLIIGPWGHTDVESKYYKGKFMGEAADDINLRNEYVRWFNYWLKGIKNGIMDEPLVQLYALKSDKWYSDEVYPLKNTSAKKLFLSSSGEASLKTTGGDLTSNYKKIKEGFDRYSYDPDSVAVYKKGVTDDPGSLKEILSKRSDYLFYKSAPFAKSTTILGQLSATIYASSSALDTDWFLVLMVLDKNDNFADYVSLGVLRAKFRNSLEKPELLEKNKIYKFNIDMSQCGITLQKGQKIGLIITSSFLYPFFDKNLNTGENNQTGINSEIAKQKIYHTKEHSSYITIPILSENIKR